MNKINISEKLSLFSDHWNPKIIGELNGQQVRLAKFKGDFVRHKHDSEDELFLVIKGFMQIEFDDRTENLTEGEMIIVPKGTYHKPIAPSECHVMLFEPATTLNTGDINSTFTQKKLSEI